VLGGPLAAHAQRRATKGGFPIVGWLVTGSPTSYRHSLAAFRDGLSEAGYVEGRNIRIELAHSYEFAERASPSIRQADRLSPSSCRRWRPLVVAAARPMA
jgi:putative ABC transport system substrate-binding protein